MFGDLLDETKVFKYQITLKVILKRYKPNEEIEFKPVYSNSATKTVINHKFSLENAFQQILYRIDNWINEGSGWIVELIKSQYTNISTYRPLSASSYIKLPAELRSPRKGTIKNNNRLVFPIYVSHQKFESSMDLLLVTDGNKSHYVCIKDFDRFMFHKTKNKNKKYFCKSCLQCFSSKNVLAEHKEVCLSINGAQSVRLEKGTNEFKNYFKQIPVPFKIYADFE